MVKVEITVQQLVAIRDMAADDRWGRLDKFFTKLEKVSEQPISLEENKEELGELRSFLVRSRMYLQSVYDAIKAQ